MKIQALENLRVENRGSTGPARIAPVPKSPSGQGASGTTATAIRPSASTGAVQVSAPVQFAQPAIQVQQAVDVNQFLSMTATLLKHMGDIRTYQEMETAAAGLDLSA